MNSLSQMDPRILKMLLMQQGQQRMPQEQPPQGLLPMGDPNMPTDQQQQMDPQMLAGLLSQNQNALAKPPNLDMLMALLRQKQPMPTGTQTIGIRG